MNVGMTRSILGHPGFAVHESCLCSL